MGNGLGRRPRGVHLASHAGTWGPAQSRESLRALRLRLDWGGVKCYCCGIFSAELAWRVSPGGREWARLGQVSAKSESGGARERYAGGLGPGRGGMRAGRPAGSGKAGWRGRGQRASFLSDE